MKEEVELDEAKYDLYHKDFSSAMQHSYKMAKKLYGITVDPKEIDDKVASGPRKPSEGKTNSYRLKGDKGAIQVQVYNKGGPKPFELNMYKEEVELDEGKMSAAQIAKLKKAYEPMRGKKISMASGQKLSSIMDKVDDDKQALIQLVKADIPFVSQLAVTRLITKHGMKGAEIRKMQEEVELDEEFKKGDKVTVKVAKSSDREIQQLSKKFGDTVSGVVMGQSGKILMVKTDKGQINPPVKDVMKEEVELDEAKYDLYHKDFSSAMQHSYKMAKKMYGITIDPKEIDDKVASGPRKPSEGKTNTYRLKGDKGAIQVQVYNKGGSKPFELNMYKEEVELDEAKQKPYVSSDRDGKHVMNASGKIAKSFKDMDSANAYLKKNYNKLMKEKLDTEDEPTVKKVVKMLKKASNAHAGQAKDLEKAVKEDSENEGFASDAQRRAAFASGYKEKGKKKDESAASDARRAMASDPSTKQKFSKNVSATDDDVKAADKNIIMQMRKAVSLRGNKVEFMDKKKVMIPQKIAQAVIAKYNNMKKPADKEKFQSKISKSYKSMLATLKEQNEINNKNNSLDQLKELVKEMKGKNNG